MHPKFPISLNDRSDGCERDVGGVGAVSTHLLGSFIDAFVVGGADQRVDAGAGAHVPRRRPLRELQRRRPEDLLGLRQDGGAGGVGPLQLRLLDA